MAVSGRKRHYSVVYFTNMYITLFKALHMNPAFNGSLAIPHFERSDVIEIRDGIIFVFLLFTHTDKENRFNLIHPLQ